MDPIVKYIQEWITDCATNRPSQKHTTIHITKMLHILNLPNWNDTIVLSKLRELYDEVRFVLSPGKLYLYVEWS